MLTLTRVFSKKSKNILKVRFLKKILLGIRSSLMTCKIFLLKQESLLVVSTFIIICNQALIYCLYKKTSFIIFLYPCFSILICFLFRFKGLLVSYVCLFCFLFYFLKTTPLPFIKILQYEGIALSFSLGLSIFFISLDYFYEEEEKKKSANLKEKESLFKKIQVLDEKLNVLEKSKSSLSDKFMNLTENYQKIEKEYDISKAKISHLEGDMEVLIAQKTSWVEDFWSLHREILDLSEEKKQPEEFLQKNKDLNVLWESSQKEIQELESIVSKLTQEKEELLEKEKDLLRKKETLDINYSNLLQEKQKLCHRLDSFKTDEKDDSSLQKNNIREIKLKLSHVEGLYNQLRFQFQEKDQELSLSRKKLFGATEKQLILQREKDLLLSETGEEIQLIGKLSKKIALLEEEIVILEGLISHILS